MSNIYISGKITGLSVEEYTNNFRSAAIEIEKKGNIPLNPLKFTQGIDTNDYPKLIAKCIEVLFNCDEVLLMDNWQTSKGCQIEVSVAKILNIPISIFKLC